jgi:DNA repair protein RecO (recombination protein O)
MSIQRAEAVILKTIPYGETSKILTVLTRDFGKITMLARGARDTKSKYGGSLELFTHISVIFYERETRDMQYMSDVTVLNPFLGIHNHLDRTYAALAILEMCHRAIHANEDCRAFFNLLVRTLEGLDQSRQRPMNGFLYFMQQMAENLGFKMEFDRCDYCENVMDHRTLYFNVERGRVVCESCPASLQTFQGGGALSKESFAVLSQMARSKGNGIYNIVMTDKTRNEIYFLLLKHLQYHIEELNQLNTLSFLKVTT